MKESHVTAAMKEREGELDEADCQWDSDVNSRKMEMALLTDAAWSDTN